MKKSSISTIIVAVIAGFLFLFVWTSVPTYAQEEKHEQDARPEKQEQQQDKGRQEQQEQSKDQQQEKVQQEHQQQTKEQQQEKGQQEHQQQADQQEKQQQTQGLQKEQQKAQVQQKKQPQQQAKALKKQQTKQPSKPVQHVAQAEQRGVWQQHRAQNWQTEHQTWQQRGGYNGYRIPKDRYHGHFGRNHFFRIYSLPMQIYGGFPRFQYNGYWFCMLDPWPESWSEGWYENDDVYVIYSNDGYYLYNRSHPDVAIAISVYAN